MPKLINKNNWLKIIINFCTCMLISFSIHAQNFSIEGTVKDVDNNPLPGVTVTIKGTTIGTTTNTDGQYSLSGNIENGDVVTYSFIGMQPVERIISDTTNYNITMRSSMIGLNEVVVVGYGIQKKKDITGSVALVESDELESRPNTKLGSLIQGRAAGVRVVSSSGKPSQGINIRVRGTNSITAGSEPLYVIDGVPTSDTRSLNPSDIESLTVLKDASSAAIYGAQGANGVVLITTKTGDSEKPQVRVNAYGGYSEVWKTLDVLNGEQYRDLMTEMGQNTNWERYNKNTDWQNKVFQRGASQNYQVSISGKNDFTNYYISGGWVEQKGAVRSTMMNRANFKINLDQKINNWLKVGTRVAYTKYSDVDVNDNSPVNNGGVLIGAINTPSVIGVFNDDGTYTSNPFQNWENPLASTDGSDRIYNSQRFIGNFYAQINLADGLSFKSNIGVDNAFGIYDYFLDPFTTSYGIAKEGIGTNNTDKSSFWMLENTFNFKKEIGKHNFNALAGTVSQKYKWEDSKITREKFSGNGVKTTNGGSTIVTAENTKQEKTNSSFISRLNYAFDDKYLLTANFRIDGSSVFGPEQRWGYFPSFSVGWRLSHEDFMERIDILNDMKIRLGWGIVGNDQIEQYAYFGRVGAGANYPIGGQALPGTYPAALTNNKLKWEESEQTNIGIDLSLYKGRVSIIADAYIRYTRDLLLNAPLPHSTGFDNALQNIGNLENKGMEFSVNTVNIDNAIRWNSTLNISFNRNKVTNLVTESLPMGNIAGRGEAILLEEGQPLGTLYGYVWGGVDPETGNAYYIDQAGESTFTPSPDDRQIIGNANPDFFFGINNEISYKNFGLNIFFEGQQGNDMLNATRIESESMSDPKNQLIAVDNRWRNSGDVTNIPRATWGETDNSRISTRFIEDGSYMRLKTLTVSYNLPVQMISKINLQQVKIYATAENLLTFTNYSGFDPEVNTYGGDNVLKGVDYGTYPQTRSIILGLNVTF